MELKVFDFGDSEKEEAKKKLNTESHISQGVENHALALSREGESGIQVVLSDATESTAEHPILVLADYEGVLIHHVSGQFKNPHTSGQFEYTIDEHPGVTEIIEVDKRFIEFLTWLGDSKTDVRLSGARTEKGFAVYRIHAVDATGLARNSMIDTFVQFVIDQLLNSAIPEDDLDIDDDDADYSLNRQQMLNDIQSIANYATCVSKTLPRNIRDWVQRNISLARQSTVSPEERRHAQRAMSMMLKINWRSRYFESIDPVKARQILDEELYGMDKVKQRIIETIIQINRTHTLPTYGLLLAGPAGVGKSQVAYAVARILRLPWTSLDMSTINDPEQLTGSPRVYSNAKPGRIMEAFSEAGTSNLVFIINELDKADNASGANPADSLLTLLDNIGFTDNYMECMVPTVGVYPIATANEKERISKPLMTRFALIDIPDYTPEEKMEIFKKFSLPKILKRMSIQEGECIVTDDGVAEVIKKFADQSGCRDLEQAAEHIAANCLYQIETTGVKTVTFDGPAVEKLLNE